MKKEKTKYFMEIFKNNTRPLLLVCALALMVLLILPFPAEAQTTKLKGADNYDLVIGTHESGSLECTKTFNGDSCLVIRETNTEPAILLEFTFLVENVNSITANYKYRGTGSTHRLLFEVYNYDSMEWVTFENTTLNDSFVFGNYALNDSFNFDGVTKARFNHPEGGSTNHYLDLDYLVINYEAGSNSHLNFDLTTTEGLVLFVLLVTLSVGIAMFYNALLGGLGLMIAGISILLTPYIIISVLLIMFGALLIAKQDPDEPILSKNN